MALRIVKTGTWMYDGAVPKPVDVVALDFDWWYELAKADGQLEPDEVPLQPDERGWLYYARFRSALRTTEPTSVDSPGHRTPGEAMRAAASKVPGEIQWDDDRA